LSSFFKREAGNADNVVVGLQEVDNCM